MPGSIHISATQPSVSTPLFLQVAVGKREYSGNIEQDDLSFPVTSLRESMVIMLYSADRELISKSELKTKAIVESRTMDAVFTLDSGGEIILQVQFLLNDDDRKRIQEMRNSAMKRKQQELLGDGSELNFPDSSLSKRLIEKISNIQSKGAEQSKSLDDLQERAVLSGINVDPRMKKASRDLLLQRGVRDTLSLDDPSGSNKGNSIPESKSSSSVKKMIRTFEGTTPQGIISETDVSPTPTDSGSTQAGKTVIPFDDHIKTSEPIKNSEPIQSGMPKTTESKRSRRSETGASITPTESGNTQTGKIVIPFDDHKASNYVSGETVSSQHIKTSEPVQAGMPKTTESRRSSSSETGISPTPTDSTSTQAGKTVIPFDERKASNYRSGKTVSSKYIKTSEPAQDGMPKTTISRRSSSSETGISPTPTESGNTQAGKTVIPFDDHKASNYGTGKTVLSQHIKMSEPVQAGMPKTIESRRSISPTPTDSGSTQARKTVIPFDDRKASNYKSGKTVSSQHIKTSEPVQVGMPKTTESRRSSSSETGISPTPTDLGSTQAGKTVIPFDGHKASNYGSGKTVLSQQIKMSEPVQTGMPKATESRRSHSSETGVSPTPTDSGSTQAGKTIIHFDDHKASNYMSEETGLSQHIKMSELVQTEMPKTTESKRSHSSETGVSPTPTDSGSTQAGKTVIPFDDHKASNYMPGKTFSSQHRETSELVQTGMTKTTESRRSHSSETGVSPTPTDSGSMQAGKTVIPFDDHRASNYRSGETVSSQHIKMSEPVQIGMPKTAESRRSCRSETGVSRRSETGVSPTPTNDLGSTQAGRTGIPFDDHKASNYSSGKTVSSQHIKTSAPVQTGMPKTTESRRSRRSSSRDGASKQNLRENELIRTKRRPQAKHQCSFGPSYSAEQMHSRDYVERPLNYLVATSTTWIHPHICVTSASKQLKDLLELERLNSLAHVLHTGKSQHVQERIQENESSESIATTQTRISGFPMIDGWLINQGVRAAIVLIACGAMFFNNR